MHRFLAACSLLFLLPFTARASGPYLSEVAWAGSSASLADEWLELCAAPGTELSGWSIEGAAASPIVLASGSVVGPSGAFLVANYAADDARSTLAVAPDLVTTAVSLSNSALAVTLRDAAGNAVDAAGDGGAPPAGASGGAKTSMERASAGGAWTTAAASSGFDEGATESGTPGSCAIGATDVPAETAGPTASATSVDESVPAEEPPSPPEPPKGAVRISELFPSPPSGEKEWVELVNPSNVGEFLDGWTIEDAAGTRTRLEGLLLPWSRTVIVAPRGSLNNDGDAVTLRDALGREIDRASYGKIDRGHAVMRVELGEEFRVTRMPTPGAPNVFVDASEEAPIPDAAPIPPEPPAATRVPAMPTTRPTEPAAPTTAPSKAPAEKAPAKPAAPKAPAPKYKGAAYVATVAVPPGVYAKTRAYVLLDGRVEELRFSKAPGASWTTGDRIAFVAQEKSEDASAFLLANPNSVRLVGSASATFAAIDAWPGSAGGYRFTAEVASVRGSAIEASLGGVEGDVLGFAGMAAALKPGDLVRIEGYVSPGARPRVVLAHEGALTLEKAYAPSDAPTRDARLPPHAAALTLAAAAVGVAAYLRAQRLKRLAIAQAPVAEGVWE
jgi:hypothetical protein